MAVISLTATFIFSFTNDLVTDRGQYVFYESEFFNEDCVLLDNFKPQNITELLVHKGCRYGIYDGIKYYSGNVGKNSDVPIALAISNDNSYDRSYAYIVGGPGGDYLSNIKVQNHNQNSVHSIVKSKKVLILSIGYSGVFERTNLNRNEILTSKKEIEDSITDLDNKLKDLRIIANSYGAYLYALASYNLPATPVYFTYPLLSGREAFFQYFSKQSQSKENWNFGHIKKWRYDESQDEVYGSQEELVLIKDFMINYFGDYGTKTNYELFDKRKIKHLTILYSTKDERTSPNEISNFRDKMSKTKIFNLNTETHGCNQNLKCLDFAQSIIFN